ncbi:MAG: hypothetical protein ACJ797_10250 [Ktedonobacteraceae bacterium]
MYPIALFSPSVTLRMVTPYVAPLLWAKAAERAVFAHVRAFPWKEVPACLPSALNHWFSRLI